MRSRKSQMKSKGTLCGVAIVWRRLATFFLSALVIFAVPAARAAVTFPMYVSSGVSIVQVNSAGVVSPFVTVPGGSNPGGLAFDGSGNLYVADFVTGQISKITSGGAVSLFATVTNPIGLAFDGSGNLYAADYGTSQVSKITSGGVVSLFATLPAGSNPYVSYGLAFDGGGNLYAADVGTDQISKITHLGVVSHFATLPAGSFPIGLAFDGSGNLYVADNHTNQISKITSGGAVSLFAPAGSNPWGLAFDSGGNLYAADNGSGQNNGPGQISKISPDGLTVSTFATGIAQPRFIAFAPVPEPSCTVLLAATAGSLLLRRRRRRA